MKVAKFGGSSLSSAEQIKKVANIVMNDSAIKAMVVSAPGKRFEEDTKVTDLLIALHVNHITGLDTEEAVNSIIERYESITQELNIGSDLLAEFKGTLNSYLSNIKDPDQLLDALKSCGEDFNAQLISTHLNQSGYKTKYLSPKKAGIVVTDEPSNARLLLESYDNLSKLIGSEEFLVIPGFFGVSKEDNIVTFPRGGSDITGAIVARGMHADIYENYTDESFVYSAHPGKIENPHPIEEITYREMRELSYSGFDIFHDEALEPLYDEKIPVQIKNTNAPEIEGTKIVSSRELHEDLPIVGISNDSGFTAISISDYLMNRTIGYTKKLLEIFEDYNISIEHIPSGIDNLSIIVRSKYLADGVLETIQQEINERLAPEYITVEDDLSLLVIVGEGMQNYAGLANKVTTAFTKGNISIRMINQGASETSMTFTVKIKDEDKALRYVYQELFPSED